MRFFVGTLPGIPRRPCVPRGELPRVTGNGLDRFKAWRTKTNYTRCA